METVCRAPGPPIGGKSSEYLDIADVLLSPWPAVTQLGELLHLLASVAERGRAMRIVGAARLAP